MVVWAFFEGNDLSNVEEYPGKAARVAGQHALWQDFWFRSLSRNLLALYFRLQNECVPNARIQEYRAEFRDENNSSSPVFFAPSEVVSYPEETVREVQSYLREAYELCRDRHIRFMVVFVPEKYRVYHDLSNVRLSTDELRSWTVHDLPRLLRRLLADLSPDIEYIDLTPALKAESRKGIATYLPDDTHWTADGAQGCSGGYSPGAFAWEGETRTAGLVPPNDAENLMNRRCHCWTRAEVQLQRALRTDPDASCGMSRRAGAFDSKSACRDFGLRVCREE